MKKSASIFSGLLIGSSVLSLAACTSVPSGPPPQLYSFDLLNADLAKRVKDQILGPNSESNSDFIVGLTNSADPIGTIYRDGTTRAISRSSCIDLTPATVDAFYFPSKYTLTREAAVALGLDSALTKIAELGINLKNEQGIILEFSQNKQTEVDDKQVENVISLNQVCKATIADQQVRFVRGYVSLKRNFTASAAKAFDVNIKAVNIGTLTIKPVASTREVKIVDDAPASFIQIMQVVKGSLNGGRPGPSTPPQETSLVYIQVDASDPSNNAPQLEKALKAENIMVAGEIEKIKSSQMPAVTQVRFFNDTDKSKADRILAIVRRFRPNAIAIRVGLSAPSGQTEVWLTR
jgi:hypothetical protein